jgi:hypothetical protein
MNNLETASSGFLHQIPVELWNQILHAGQGFTVEDLKTLCFVAPLFKAICQPLVYKSLAFRGAKRPCGYSFEEVETQEVTHDVNQWKQDVTGLIRAERRLHLIGDHPSLSTHPRTISVGVMSYAWTRSLPPADKTALSKAAYETFSKLNGILLHTLPSFTRLLRLEIGVFPIDDKLMRAMSLHPTLRELKLRSCSFTTLTFPIPSIRLLECSELSQDQAAAAFCLASSQHLEELRIENMEVLAILKGLRARPESKSMLTKVHRLTIVPTGAKLDLVGVETMLSYVPALRQLDVGEASISVPEENQALKSSIIPCLRRFAGPVSFARYVVPGRPVTDIRCVDSTSGAFAETLAELQVCLNPLCLSTATAEGITTLHLPPHMIVPIWLLSRLVAETFPCVVDLKLTVSGLVNPMDRWFTYPRRSCRRRRRRKCENHVVGPLGERTVEGMVKDIMDNVENELVSEFYNPCHTAKGVDYATIRVSPPPFATHTSSSLQDIDGVPTLAYVFCNDAGVPSRHPDDYQVRRFASPWSSTSYIQIFLLQEALTYFTLGWYPLPAGIQTLLLMPGVFPSLSDITWPMYPPPFGSPGPVEEMTLDAVVTALGKRYPSLGSVTLMASNGCLRERMRIPGIGNGATRWTVLET